MKGKKQEPEATIGDQLQHIEKSAVKEWKYLSKVKIKDENHLLFASFIIILVAILVVNTLYVLNRDPSTNVTHHVSATTDTSQVLTSLQTATLPAAVVSISDVSENDRKDPAFMLAEGETLLTMTIRIKNTSPGQQEIIPTSQLFVRSRDGDYAPLHPSIYVTKPLGANKVAAGQTVSGEISFAVPKQLADPLLYVDLGWNDQAPVVFHALK